MQWSRRMIVALMFAFPAAALAQTLKPADLVGTWVQTQTWKEANGASMKREWLLTLRADSTWRQSVKLNGQDDPDVKGDNGEWYLSSDSLWLGNPAVTDTNFYFGSEYFGGQIEAKWPAQKVTLQGGKLYLVEYGYFLRAEAEARRQGRMSSFQLANIGAREFQRAP